MGGTSQSRKSSNKKVMSRKDEMKGDPKQKRSTSNQPTLDGKRPPTQFNPATARLDPATKGTYVDEVGNRMDCKRCIRGSSYQHGHELSTPTANTSKWVPWKWMPRGARKGVTG